MKPIDTVLREHKAALARRERARQAFVEADADVIGLTHVIRGGGRAGLPGSSLDYSAERIEWMRAAERASSALFAALLPEASPSQIESAHARWKLALSRLLTRR